MRRRPSSLNEETSDTDSEANNNISMMGDGVHNSNTNPNLPLFDMVVPKHKHRAPIKRFFLQLAEGKLLWAKCLSIFFAATLTYTYKNAHTPHPQNVQIAIMTVIVMIGATPMKSQIIPVAIGAFVGGHNIIGSTGELLHFTNKSHIEPKSYAGLLLLSVVVGLVFDFFGKHKILDGYGGRLGTSTFVGMNICMITVFGPFGVIDWDRYYYGLYHVIKMAEEDSSVDLTKVWKWSEEAELAIGYVLAVIWLGWISGLTRILHNDYIQKLQQQLDRANEENDDDDGDDHEDDQPKPTPTPPPPAISNVTIPCLLALLNMLIVNATQYEHAAGLYNGFAVGSYVGMASLGRIPTAGRFAVASLLAALWGLLLTPVCVGFAGKSGFTSMLGHVTYVCLKSAMDGLSRKKHRAAQQQRMIDDEEANAELDEQRQEEQSLVGSNKKDDPATSDDDDEDIPSLRPELRAPAKFIKPREPFLTKQQRRQQQRMKALQKQQQKQQQQQQQQQRKEPVVTATTTTSNTAAPKLHHRAWSANPSGDDPWKHPMEEDPNQSESHNIV